MSKTQVNEIDRNIYDIKNKDDYEFKMQKGLSREIVEQISKRKNEPDWMLEIRLKALEMYEKLELPTWGPDLSELKMDEIATYVKPKTNLNSSWEDVPDEIKDTFDKLRCATVGKILLTLAIRLFLYFYIYFVQLRIAKVKRLHKPWTSSTCSIYQVYRCQPRHLTRGAGALRHPRLRGGGGRHHRKRLPQRGGRGRLPACAPPATP